jgi:lysophospholipid acyltransferase (LPLAT)-like uncharacterized protein
MPVNSHESVCLRYAKYESGASKAWLRYESHPASPLQSNTAICHTRGQARLGTERQKGATSKPKRRLVAPPTPLASLASRLRRKIDGVTTAAPEQLSIRPQFSLRQRFMLTVVPRLVWATLSVVGRTWHFETIAELGATPLPFGAGAGAEIFCFWHQCVLPCAFYFRRTGATIIVSQSFDGELIARTLELFGYKTVRGSSSRGAHEALLGLKAVIESGHPAIFTADGPRGPIYRTKSGPIRLAALTGARIGAFHLEPRRAWSLNSWDRFLVPMPFTPIAVSWSRWTQVPINLAEDKIPDDMLDGQREQLNAALERARIHALEHFGKAEPVGKSTSNV